MIQTGRSTITSPPITIKSRVIHAALRPMKLVPLLMRFRLYDREILAVNSSTRNFTRGHYQRANFLRGYGDS